MKLVWTRAASADRKKIREYIAQDNPAAALALDELFREKTGQLANHPNMSRPGRVTGTRELVVHPHYVIVHDVAVDAVRILRVLHTSRHAVAKIL